MNDEYGKDEADVGAPEREGPLPFDVRLPLSGSIAMSRYNKSAPQKRRTGLPGEEWGCFVRYLEIGDDSYATRQVDVFENGHALRYDRSHYVDDYGMLADMRWSTRWSEWWPGGQEISPAQFGEVWRDAASSPAGSLQADSSHPQGMPPEPPWLRVRR
jgi:hypothetical protein